MMEQDSERHPIEVLAEEFTERLRRGEKASAEEYAASHPELAEEIRELFPTIAEMEGLKRRKESTARTVAFPEGFRLERLGDFRILHEIGRGGMGIVYEAEQESLGRRVAIKVLPRHLRADSKGYQRFEREARTAAKLHHTNIVPIFGVGHQDGYHYYVMQFIPGVGLDEVLDEIQRTRIPGERSGEAGEGGFERKSPGEARARQAASIARALSSGRFGGRDEPAGSKDRPPAAEEPRSPGRELPSASPETAEIGLDAARGAEAAPAPSREDREPGSPPRPPGPIAPGYWRCAAEIGLQAASALQYAHSQGTLHRDIKPSNLLLDSQGFVWITDFGLAKPVEGDAVSQTGDIVGTLRYMAPEQLSGQAEMRSDVYSLGLTLYELIALRPAYPESDTKKLIQAIAEGHVPWPRKLRPEIPRDLETIVMKSIAREPAHRYRSAGELAADLRRFLDDLPILARRISLPGRLWRWSRRNRALAGLTGTALALLVLLAVSATVGYVQTKKAMEGESKSSTIAEEALDRIFARFAPHRSVPSSSLTIGESESESIEVPMQPVLSRPAAALLEHLLEFYDRLAELRSDDPNRRKKVAEANRRVGDIRQRLGNYEEARAAYERALAVYQGLAERSPGDEDLRIETARTCNEIGSLLREMKAPGRPFHEKALALLEPISATSSTSSPTVRFEQARACYFLGKGPSGRGPMLPTPGFLPPQEGAKARGPSDDRKPEFRPQEPEGKRVPPRGRPGRFDWGRDLREREESVKKAIGLLEGLLAESPGVPDYRQLLARCHRETSFFPPAPGQPPSQGGRAKAIEILQKLVEDFPDVPDYRYDLSKIYSEIEGSFGRWGGAGEVPVDEVVASLQKALEIIEGLVADHPQVPNYAAMQFDIHLRLATVLNEAQRFESAEVNLRKALDLLSTIVRRYPEASSYKVWKAGVQEFLATTLWRRGQLEEAFFLLDGAAATLESLLQGSPKDPQMMPARFLLARILEGLAGVLSDLGDEDGSIEARWRAEELAPRFPMPPGPRPENGSRRPRSPDRPEPPEAPGGAGVDASK